MNTTPLAVKTAPSRHITHRTQGVGQGPIVRLVSPGDIGQLIKPFVFLDWFAVGPTPEADVATVLAERYHPHSGIMTVTTLLSGAIFYEDTTGRSGILNAGGIEYMQAGGGVWHTGSAVGSEPAKGFQLWVALPPELEDAKAQSTYISRPDVPKEGSVRVILGSYGHAQSPILPTLPLNYIYVSLKAGEQWFYHPPKDHDVTWVAVHEGELNVDGIVLRKEIAIFEESSQSIAFMARGNTDFVLGSAEKHPYPLVLGPYSVHTNPDSLQAGRAEIQRIQREQKR